MKSRIAFAVLVAFAVAVLAAGVAFAQENAKVAGKWESKFTTPSGETRTTTFTFEQDGDKLKGTVSGGMGGEAPLTGTVKGKEVKFTVTRQFQGNEVKSEYTATVEGDTMKGKVVTPRGEREWSATKAK
jgi:hypothetical protein